MFFPASISQNAFGAFSKPSTTVSSATILPCLETTNKCNMFSKHLQEPADEFANAVLCMLNMIQEQKSFSCYIVRLNIFLDLLAQNIWIRSIRIVVRRNLSAKNHVGVFVHFLYDDLGCFSSDVVKVTVDTSLSAVFLYFRSNVVSFVVDCVREAAFSKILAFFVSSTNALKYLQLEKTFQSYR